MRKLISPFGYPYLMFHYKNEIQTVIQHVLFSFIFINTGIYRKNKTTWLFQSLIKKNHRTR